MLDSFNDHVVCLMTVVNDYHYCKKKVAKLNLVTSCLNLKPPWFTTKILDSMVVVAKDYP